jgi:23S rRNA (pseudouridine1915-N3)-methyltransferase
MKIRLLVIGKTEGEYLKSGMMEYFNRLKRYIPFEYLELPALKNAASLSWQEQQSREAETITKNIKQGELLLLLDEKGKQFSSKEFASFLNSRMITGVKSAVFVVGGPFGFHPQLKGRADELISLSKMTFSHQMVRLLFIEQLYRAFTILRNESYHHE